MSTLTSSAFSSLVSPVEFLASLPITYRTVFDGAAAAEHAAIVNRRQGSHYFELWRALPDELYVLCLVAEDRPGLLSAVTTALTVVGFHIEGAQIFTRKSSPNHEALDFFWVRLDPPSSVSTVQECVQKLNTRFQANDQ
jgi:[protein-PII] uridylyltransferase